MLLRSKNWKKTLAVFVAVLVLSFGLRFLKVIFDKQPVFGDEAIYIRWSQVMRAEPSLRFIPQTDGKQPLFMWATIPFLKIFSDPVVAGRTLSVFTGVITTAGIFFLILLLIKSRKIAFLASLIYAISPFSVFFDSLALADSMLSMFGVWSLVFAIITVNKVRLDTAMLTGFSLGGALLTKSPAVFFSLLIPINLILNKWPSKFKERFKNLSVFVFLFTFTYIIAYGLYNILRLGQDFHMISIRNSDYVNPITHIFKSPLDPLLPFLGNILDYFRLIGPWPIIVLFIIGVYLGLKYFKKESLILLAWGVLPLLAVAEFSKVMTARYIYFTLPYLISISAMSGFLIFSKKSQKVTSSGLIKKTVGLTVLVFAAISLLIDFRLITNPRSVNLPRSERSGYFEEWTSGYGIKEISKLILNEYTNNPNQKIVVGTEGYFGTLPDGLQIFLNDTPEITVIGVGQPLRNVPESLIESKRSGNKTYLVVNSTRLIGEPEKMGLKLVESYDKAFRPDYTFERLLLYEVIDI